MLHEIGAKYQSLINHVEVAQMLQDDFLPIFQLEFKSFEWKCGWMFCEKKDNVKVLSVCQNKGMMCNLTMVYDEQCKRTRYYFTVSPVEMKHREGKSVKEIQAEVVNLLLNKGDDNVCIHTTEESKTWIRRIMFLDLHGSEVKYYKVGNLSYSNFSDFFMALEDFLLIPLYLNTPEEEPWQTNPLVQRAMLPPMKGSQ